MADNNEELFEYWPDVSGWSRRTVADGKWLQNNTIHPLEERTDILKEAIEDLDSETSAEFIEVWNSLADESAARVMNDDDLSAALEAHKADDTAHHIPDQIETAVTGNNPVHNQTITGFQDGKIVYGDINISGSQITSGVVALSAGGLGTEAATSAGKETARNNLDVYSKNEVEYIANNAGGFLTAASGTGGEPDVPTADANPKKIYLVKNSNSTKKRDVYSEWIVTGPDDNREWTCIGETIFSLAGYYNELDFAGAVPQQGFTVVTSAYDTDTVSGSKIIFERSTISTSSLTDPYNNGSGIEILSGDNNKISHINVVGTKANTTAGKFGLSATDNSASAFNLPYVTYDINGHYVSAENKTITLKAYTGEKGISADAYKIGHTNNINSGTIGSKTGSTETATITVPWADYDGQGHITTTGSVTYTVPVYSGVSGIKVDNSGTTRKVGHTNHIAASAIGAAADKTESDIKIPYIKFDEQGHISAAEEHTLYISAYTAESGLSGAGHKIGHNTTTLGSGSVGGTGTSTSDSIVVPHIEYDRYGHITATNSATYSVIGYTVENGLSGNNTTHTIGHEKDYTGGTISSTSTTGTSINIPTVTFDKWGHVSNSGSTTHTVPTYSGISGISVSNSGQTRTVGHSAAPLATGTTTAGMTANDTGREVAVPNIKCDAYGHVSAITSYKFTVSGYDAASGIQLVGGTTFGHSASNTIAGTIGATASNSAFTVTGIPYVQFDEYGHINGSGTRQTTVLEPGEGLSADGITLKHKTYGTAGNYGPTGDTTATSVTVPAITTDKFGHASVTNRTFNIQSATTADFGIVKVGSTAGTVASGIHYHSEYEPVSAMTAYYTKSEVDTEIGKVGAFVTAASTSSINNPSTKVIYLIKDTSVTGTDKYKEYIYLSASNTFEMIGDTSLDLSDYQTTAGMSAYVLTSTNSALSSNVNMLAAQSATWNNVSNKLDTTATNNWDTTAYSGGDGIKVLNHVISVSGNYVTPSTLNDYVTTATNSVLSSTVNTLTAASSTWNTVSNKLDVSSTNDWDKTAYSAENCISGTSNHKIGHTTNGSLGAGNFGLAAATTASAVSLPYVSYDAYGHITGASTNTFTLPTANGTTAGIVKLGTGASDAASGNHTHPGMLLPGSADDGKMAVASWDSQASSGSVEWEDKPYELIHWDGTKTLNIGIGIYQSAANILAQNMLPVLVADYPDGPGHFYPLNVIDGACGYHFKDYDNDIWVNTAGTISISENCVNSATNATYATRADSATSADLTNHVSDACSAGKYIDIGWETSAIGNAEEIKGAAVYVQRGDQILIKDASRAAICKYINGNSTSGAPVCINSNGFLVTSAKMALPYPAEQNGESWFAVRSNYDAINSTFFEVDVNATPARAGIWANATSGQNAWQGWLIYTDAKKNCLVGDVVVLTGAGATSPGRLAAVYTDDIYKTKAASFTLSETDFNIDPPKKGDMLRVVNTGSSNIQITYNDYNGTSRTKTIGVGNFITVLCLSNSGGTIKAAIANNN